MHFFCWVTSMTISSFSFHYFSLKNMYININACNNVLMHLHIIKTNYNISIMIWSSLFTIMTSHIHEIQCYFHQFQEIDNKAFHKGFFFPISFSFGICKWFSWYAFWWCANFLYIVFEFSLNKAFDRHIESQRHT